MPLLDKSELLKTLRAVDALDSTASPFIALQFGEEASVAVYRSSSLGTMRSPTYLPETAKKTTYVSLSHLQDCLRVLMDDRVEVGHDPNGILRLASTDATFESELRVHTVPVERAGLKQHTLGQMLMRLDPAWFAGFDSRPFKVATPPVIADGRVMLATNAGIVFWQGPPEIQKINVNPRETFLDYISQGKCSEIVLTSGGYWGAVSTSPDLVLFTSAHTFGRPLYDAYQTVGEVVEKFPAERLVFSLRAAAGLADDEGKVEFHPTEGVVTRDKFGNPSRFSVNTKGTWTKFAIISKTAKLLVDALSQAAEEEIQLWKTTSGMRITRGNWQVDFKVFD